jgi:hypothetical protein
MLTNDYQVVIQTERRGNVTIQRECVKKLGDHAIFAFGFVPRDDADLGMLRKTQNDTKGTLNVNALKRRNGLGEIKSMGSKEYRTAKYHNIFVSA